MASTEQRSFTGEISMDKPNPARIYDCWLGGHHNFAADRASRTLIDILDPGSHVAIAHVLLEEETQEAIEKAAGDHGEGAPKPRWRDEIKRFFDGLELVEPGLVRAPLWRPAGPDDRLLDSPEGYTGLAGVARRPKK